MESVSTLTFNHHRLAVALLDAGKTSIVIFCHGYRGSSIGPNRFFVDASRQLAAYGVSSLRFDQYGSGNSEGEFRDSSFDDWVASTKAIVAHYQKQGYKVCLFGQSMGAATVIKSASELTDIAAIVAWVPDPSVEPFVKPTSGFIEEHGQIVRSSYWREAHAAHIDKALHSVVAPAYIVQCSDDEYVSVENHKAIVANAQPNHIVEMFQDHKHSSWSYQQAQAIIAKSTDFITQSVRA